MEIKTWESPAGVRWVTLSADWTWVQSRSSTKDAGPVPKQPHHSEVREATAGTPKRNHQKGEQKTRGVGRPEAGGWWEGGGGELFQEGVATGEEQGQGANTRTEIWQVPRDPAAGCDCRV